ncbi:MAG: LysR substrate-binding domain-containing protein [Porticoccaceae bacterium]
MNLTQLRFIVAIADANLNITHAAARVHATQPGLSKQLKQLEDELGLQLFTRRARSISAITDAGEKVLRHARVILAEAANIRALAANLRGESAGVLEIATTHTQARYVLPRLIAELKQGFPQVAVKVLPGSDAEALAHYANGEADLTLVSSALAPPPADLALPVYRWERVALVPRSHPLALLKRPPTLADLTGYPLISYETSRDPGSSLQRAFAEAGLSPEISITAAGADLIKTYVRNGLGVGILAEMAIEPGDRDLLVLSLVGRLPTCTTWLLLRRDRVLREYTDALIALLIPAVDGGDVRRALREELRLALDPAPWTARVDLHLHPPLGDFQI